MLEKAYTAVENKHFFHFLGGGRVANFIWQTFLWNQIFFVNLSEKGCLFFKSIDRSVLEKDFYPLHSPPPVKVCKTQKVYNIVRYCVHIKFNVLLH